VNSNCECAQVPVRAAVAVHCLLCVQVRFLVSVTVVCEPGCGGKERRLLSLGLLLFHQKHSANNMENLPIWGRGGGGNCFVAG
jgi:hypothetical protein